MRSTVSIAGSTAAAALLACLFNGCAPASKILPGAQSAEHSKSKKDFLSNAPNAITGHKWHIPYRAHDPDSPNGPQIPIVTLDAEQGTIHDPEYPTIVLHEVRAALYHNGKHSGDLTSPQVTAMESQRFRIGKGGLHIKPLPILIGTGGVRMTTSGDLPHALLTADRVTWDTRTDRIIAEGHAHLQGTDKQGRPVDIGGNVIRCDTSLQNAFVGG